MGSLANTRGGMHNKRQGLRWSAAAVLLLCLAAVLVPPVQAQTTGTVPPPRAIGDVLAILDQQKPNPGLVDQRRRTAESQPPADAEGVELAHRLRRVGG